MESNYSFDSVSSPVTLVTFPLKPVHEKDYITSSPVAYYTHATSIYASWHFSLLGLTIYLVWENALCFNCSAGKILEDDKPLSSYKIEEKNFVVVMVTKVSELNVILDSMKCVGLSLFALYQGLTSIACLPVTNSKSCWASKVWIFNALSGKHLKIIQELLFQVSEASQSKGNMQHLSDGHSK